MVIDTENRLRNATFEELIGVGTVEVRHEPGKLGFAVVHVGTGIFFLFIGLFFFLGLVL